jgi:hypothetical protein
MRRVQANRYDAKTFKNPLFGDRGALPRWKKYLLSFFVVAFLVGIGWLVFFGPFSTIKTIAVSGLTTIPNTFIEDAARTQMQGNRFGIVPQWSRYTFSVSQFAQTLQDTYDFTSLSVVMDGRTLNVVAEERVSELVWKSGDRMLFLDLTGMATRSLYDYELAQIYTRLGQQTVYIYDGTQALPLQPSIPILVDVSATPIESNSEVLSPMHAETIIAFDKAARALQLNPMFYQIEKPHANWLTVQIAQGCKILIDGTRGVGEQEGVLETVLKEYRDQLSTLEYIDIRFGDHVYIK